MSSEKKKISSTLIPQTNYRKSTSKELITLNTTIPPIGPEHPAKDNIIKKVKNTIIMIHEVVLKQAYKGKSIENKIQAELFKKTTKKIPTELEKCWEMVEKTILNYVKVHYLNQHIERFILNYEKQVGFLINKYKRHLPQHVSDIEGDDLQTIAQLELIETFKAWNPEKNNDIWPLAYTRINGAMKDHIRYISKSDPTRFYDWVTDAANLYLAVNDDNSHELQIENSTELERALKILTEKEKKIVTLYINDDLTFNEISKKIQLSESQISRIYKQALKKIKELLK